MKPFLKFFPTFLLIFFYGFGIIFRKFLWCDIPVAKGDAYGPGDLVELLVYGGVMGISGLVFAQSLVLFFVKRFKDVRLGALLIVISLVAALTYSQVHKFVVPVCS
jgi:predicted tellurium resistance membrane protein TerC